MKNLQVTEKVQLSVGLKFTFMGVDLSSYYKKTADGYQIFLAPANVSNDVQLTLKEMIGQFNGMAGEGALSEDDVKSKIAEEEDPQVVNAIYCSIIICFNKHKSNTFNLSSLQRSAAFQFGSVVFGTESSHFCRRTASAMVMFPSLLTSPMMIVSDISTKAIPFSVA